MDIREINEYPKRPLIFSNYQLDPPTIIIYRYLPAENWLNLLSQHTIHYYGPWYYLFVAFRFYFHLEINGYYEIERKWHHHLFGKLCTLEERAYHFTQQVLGTLHSLERFEEAVEKSYKPLP